MTRRLAVSAIASAITAATLPAASAGHTYICVGTGSMTISGGLYYVAIGPSVSADITSLGVTCGFLITDPVHVHVWISLVSGSITGNCGNASSTLTVNDGSSDHTGSFTSFGSVLVFTGGITGAASMTPAPGESCLPGGPGADSFLMQWDVVLS